MSTAVWSHITAGEALVRLATARAAGHLMDDTVSVVYLDALQDVDVTFIRKACRELGVEARGQYETALPSVGVIRDRAREIADRESREAAQKLLAPMPLARESHEPTFFCLDCFDEPNAWRLYACLGTGVVRSEHTPPRYRTLIVSSCGRSMPHSAHSYAERCACSDVNPVIARHRERANRHLTEGKKAK